MTGDTEWRAVPHPSASHWEVYGPNGFSIGKLTEAQAKLIAAAPDMLAALKLWASDKYDDAAKAPRATAAALKKATP